MSGFDQDNYVLDGVELARPIDSQIADLSETLSAQDPWRTLEIPAESLATAFSKSVASKQAWAVLVAEECSGIVSIKPDWLLGPYLNVLGLLPSRQGAGVGSKILVWMEEQARISASRNMYLCVSDFNSRALKFYQSFGFEAVGEMEGLIAEGHAEILMRKRLF